MYPSPVKSKQLSPLKGSRQSSYRKSSIKSPHQHQNAADSHHESNGLLHPILDGSNQSERQLAAIGRQQQDSNVVASRREWNPSDIEFIDGKSQSKLRKITDEATPNSTQSAMDVDTSSSGLNTGGNQDDNTGSINPKDWDATDDESSSGEEEEAGTIPTLDTYQPREPSYTKANTVPFHTLCKRLDLLWNKRRSSGKKAVSKQERLKYLLPDTLLKYLQGGSPYPFMRLICPDHDSSRPHTGLKEATIAKVWGDAIGVPSNSKTYKKLTHYRDPEYNGTNAGDLSVVIHQLTEDRYGSSQGNGSNLTVGDINDWLDVLVDIVKDRFDIITTDREENSAWKTSLENAIGIGGAGKKMKKHDRYVTLLEKLISKNLSPVEHKWIVRILLQRMEIGINFNSILDYYNPHAKTLYSAFNNMKELCKRLSDPKYVALLKMTHDQNARDIIDKNREIWRPQSQISPEIQKTVSPMLSHRTSFERYLKDIAYRHNELDKVLPANSPAKSSLALKHPAFICEIKMDGERMLVHIKRGEVMMHTRRNVWYSPLYSPALGPALRAAISQHDVDVILDGEIVAWDADENKAIPFGTNRAVAELRRYQRAADGSLDERDCNLHKNTRDANVMTIARDKMYGHGSQETKHIQENNARKQYFLKYVVFDILFVDGPGAKSLIANSSELFPRNEPMNPGSIVNYDLIRRKRILYNLIEPQQHEVELIPSIVVRSDGTSMNANDYFFSDSLEYGKPPCAMDSIVLAMCEESKTTEFDMQRLGSRSHDDIEIQRAIALEHCYREIVEAAGSEGLVLKDLSSPYYLGAASRSLRYWYKLKPDYDASGQASDIDVLVLGGKYADGFRQAGFVSSLLVGIIDDRMGIDEGNIKYLTLCKVNFNRDIEQVMKTTGFQKADIDQPSCLGKWFEVVDDTLPGFISEWSFQRSPQGDSNGWKPRKIDRPDLWINPEDSFVLTLNSAEIISSDSMSAGLCLRFPRITNIRAEGFDQGPKPHDEVQTFTELSTLFIEKEGDHDVDHMLFNSQAEIQSSRFMTPKQLESSGKQMERSKLRKQTDEVKAFYIPEVETLLSHALDGLIFTVLPGNYNLDSDAFAAAEAKENGWAEEASAVSSREHVIRFVKSHGGQCELSSRKGCDYILGGTIDDPKVAIYRDLIAATNENDIMFTTTKRDAETRSFFEMGGITKWTFPFSIVTKFLKLDAGNVRKSILQIAPALARPRRADYLLITKIAAASLNNTEDAYGLATSEESNLIDFQRALAIVGRENAAKKQRLSVRPGHRDVKPTWQSTALSSLDESDRWVFGCASQKLWPYIKDAVAGGQNGISVVYPDVFRDVGFEDDMKKIFSDEERWENDVDKENQQSVIFAVLPLLQTMGAVITAHLHSNVTHILCEMKSKKILKWTSTVPRSVFTNPKTGALIHERLASLEESVVLSGKKRKDVMLVSPEWVEEKWNE